MSIRAMNWAWGQKLPPNLDVDSLVSRGKRRLKLMRVSAAQDAPS